MWCPDSHAAFPPAFQEAVKTMLMASRRPESIMYLLQEEIVLFIMNKCSWDWFGRSMVRPDVNSTAAQPTAASTATVTPSASRTGRGGVSGGGQAGVQDEETLARAFFASFAGVGSGLDSRLEESDDEDDDDYGYSEEEEEESEEESEEEEEEEAVAVA